MNAQKREDRAVPDNDWSRPPQAIPGRDETLGFAERTRRNLDFIMSAHDERHEDVHVVTQVVLSLLGIVVFPFERYMTNFGHDFKLKELEAWGWPGWRHEEGSRRPTTLWHLVRNLRNATAHSNIEFSSDSRRLDEVFITFKSTAKDDNWHWTGSVRGDQLLDFCQRFLKLIDDYVG